MLIDIRIKKLIKIEEIEKEELKKKNENINAFLDDGDWSSYRKNKKNKVFGDFKKKKLKKKINMLLIGDNLKLLKNLKNNLIIFKKNNISVWKIKNNVNEFLVKYYNNLNLSRLNNINNDNYFKNLEKEVIIMIDIKNSKSKIVVSYKERCILTVTPGIIFNKLKLKEKSIKKTQKIFTLMIKLVINSVKNKIKSKNFIVHIKGTKIKLSNLVVIIKKNFNKGNDKIMFMYTPSINYKFKFKKVKSIKRRLKKKIIRFK